MGIIYKAGGDGVGTVEVVDELSGFKVMKGFNGLVVIYEISLGSKTGSSTAVIAFIPTSQVSWHNRLGHAAENSIIHTVPPMKGLQKRVTHTAIDGEVCLDTK